MSTPTGIFKDSASFNSLCLHRKNLKTAVFRGYFPVYTSVKNLMSSDRFLMAESSTFKVELIQKKMKPYL